MQQKRLKNKQIKIINYIKNIIILLVNNVFTIYNNKGQNKKIITEDYKRTNDGKINKY